VTPGPEQPAGVLTAADILDHLSTAVLVLDLHGVIEGMNTGAEILLGVSENQAIGRRLDMLRPELAELPELVIRAATDGQGYGHLLSLEPGLREQPAVEILCRVLPVGDGPQRRIIAEMFDATPWRQIDREWALISQHDASRRMLRQLAHEVRNPLGGLRGAAQLLAKRLPDSNLQEYTEVIIGEADRLAALTDSLLGPSRPLRRQNINVHEILERVITLIGGECPADVRLVRDYDPSLPLLAADADQLIQAVLNIGRNALQAVGQRGQIVFRTRALSNFAIGNARHRLVASVEIEDDGPGIPDELTDSVFYPLVTGRPDGTGLGLALSQDLISRHGGLIEFQSRPGRTVFMLRIPVQALDEASA